MNAENIHR